MVSISPPFFFFLLWNSKPLQDHDKVREINTYKAKENQRDITAWIKLDETKYIESTIQHLTLAEQKNPSDDNIHRFCQSV